MARSSSARRHARRVEDLRALRAEAPQQFRRVWQLFFQGWASEVVPTRPRADAQTRPTSPSPQSSRCSTARGASPATSVPTPTGTWPRA
jgi:hypothetical protein